MHTRFLRCSPSTQTLNCGMSVIINMATDFLWIFLIQKVDHDTSTKLVSGYEESGGIYWHHLQLMLTNLISVFTSEAHIRVG